MNRYLARLSFIALALALCVIGFTRLIDPYGYWGGPEVAGINAAKPFTGQHALPVKHQQYLRVKPRTLLIGNSRTEVGMDPESSAWPKAMLPVYNFGLPGAYVGTSVDAAIQAAEAHRPDTIIFGVDLPDFRVAQEDWRDAPHESHAPVAPYKTALSDTVSMLFSLDAATQSVAAIAEQHKAHPATTTPHGFNGLNNYNDVVATEGHAAIFANRNAEYIDRFLTQKKRLSWPGPGDNPAWRALDRMTRYCKAKNIRLQIYTYPYHADLLMIFARTGLMSELAQWRSDLHSFAAWNKVPVSDFISVNPMTTETVPKTGDRMTRMSFYWEAGHFKAAAGDTLIATMLNHTAPTIDPGTLAGDLARYELRAPKAASRIDADVKAARKRHT
jgi:hypothetical protein